MTAAGVTPDVEIVVPVHDEEAVLATSVHRLHAYLVGTFPFSWRVTIVDNGSTDHTWDEACALARDLPGVVAVRLEGAGRGGALRAAWSASDARVLAYMDVDLSTDLAALLPLVAPLLSGHSDLAIGSRLTSGARVVRGPKRELLSRGYNTLLRATLATRFSDAQCGFKAIRAEVARDLLPLVEDSGWFFDTELLVLAERAGLRIHEVPVDWVDDPDSRVDIVATAKADLRGVWRLARGLASGSIPVAEVRERLAPDRAGLTVPPSFATQAMRFVVVGLVSTAAYLLLYVALRTVVAAEAANAVALLVTAIGNTAANRRYTFAVTGSGVLRQQAQGLIAFVAALLFTSGALALLHAVDRTPSTAVELAVLVGANLLATALRFVLLRHWVFRRPAIGAASDARGDGPDVVPREEQAA